jgi:hypothetical protein
VDSGFEGLGLKSKFIPVYIMKSISIINLEASGNPENIEI